MMGLGVPEIVVLLISLAPIAAALWALITLSRIRTKQEDIWRKLEAIEQIVQGVPTR